MVSKIRKLSKKFRKAIIKTENKKLPMMTLHEFPRGACGDGSWLLGRYLKENGIEPIYYVSGLKRVTENNNTESHAWLEYRDLIIDFTIDQFEGKECNIVITKDKKWHAQFEIDNRVLADYKSYYYDNKTIEDLNDSYENIINNL